MFLLLLVDADDLGEDGFVYVFEKDGVVDDERDRGGQHVGEIEGDEATVLCAGSSVVRGVEGVLVQLLEPQDGWQMRGVPQYVEAYLPHVLVDRALDGEQLLLGDRIPRFRVVRRHGLQPFELVVVMVRFAEVVEFRGELGELFQDRLRDVRDVLDLGDLVLDPGDLVAQQHVGGGEVAFRFLEFGIQYP